MVVWVMPAAVYALASDTLIGTVRSAVLAARGRTDDERTMVDVLAGLVLWALRLTLAPRSTASGFRAWVLAECPVAPGRVAVVASPNVAALPAAETPGSAAITTAPPPSRSRGPRKTSKRARLIKAYEALQGKDPRFGDRSKVSEVARELAPGASLAWGSARSYLYRHLDAEVSS
jgi:hypothetical protein